MTSTPQPPASVTPARDRWRSLRTVAICGVLGLGLFVLTAGITLELLPDPPRPEQDLALGALLVLDLAVGTMALVVLAAVGRRTRVWAAVLIAITTSVSALAVPALVVVLVRAAASRAYRLLALVGAMVVVAAVVSDWIWSTALRLPPQPWWQVAGLAVILLCVPVLIGVARGRRDAEVTALAEAAAAAQREHAALVRQREAEEREHEARLARTREAERTRIAREMHDSLAHHLSLVAVHAGVLEYRADLGPEATREAAATVGSAARSANAELREILGVLRSGQDAAAPQSDLGRLGELITDGVTLLPAEEFMVGDVPAGTSRHAYRIVQEALTNARKHAPGQPVMVRLSGAPSAGVSIEIRNQVAAGESPGVAGLGSGLGLAGMAERARLAGGWCRAGTEGQEFVVTAWLPW
ncbi:sensor histidine kinase [Microlunatus phosphovorus]|uniref:sensor histidine kinase n=1 Tax=Microlunatus phosphovorus TaxID=29405 RepID=UPI00155A8EFC|nr:histidine kinase [Microlunatus phosphovorus]